MPDPNLAGPLADTVNGRLLDRSIRHSIYIRRLGATESARILAFLDDEVYPDLVGRVASRLERIKGRGITYDFTSKRYQDLSDGIEDTVSGGFQKALELHKAAGVEMATYEAEFQTRAMAKAMPIEWDFTLPSASSLRQIVNSNPIVLGRSIPDVFRGLSESTIARTEQAIRVGMTQGETTASIVRRLTSGSNPVLNQSRNGVEAMVRSSTNAIGSATRQATYKENSDLVKGWQFVATLDGNTTIICAKNDGKVFDLGVGPIPPLHPGCRSDDAPVLKSFRELGIPIDDLDQSERASMNGRVSGKITYPEWFKQQDAAFQDDYLGKEAGAIYRKTGLSVGAFSDKNGNRLTLPALRKLEGA